MIWKKVKLGDVVEEIRINYEPNSDEHIKYIGLEHIEQQTLKLCGIGDSSETQSTKKKFDCNDILFGSLRPYFRKVFKPKYSGVCSTDITVLKSKGENVQGFLFYIIASNNFIDHATNISNGSRMPRASWKVLAESEWNIPSPDTQTKIASILSAYDDLIENNTRRIQILEQMAQTIYKEWFVNFRFPGYENVKFVDSPLGEIPEEWEWKELLSVAEVSNGYPFQSKLFNEDQTGKPLIRIRDIRNNSTKTFTFEDVDERYRVFNGDILVGMDGDFYLGKWSGNEAWLNQRVARIRPTSNISKYFLYLSLLEPISFYSRTIVGTTVSHLGAREFQSIKILTPSKNTLAEINRILEPMYLSEINLEIKSQNLRHTRDLLLPKLMSGEVLV